MTCHRTTASVYAFIKTGGVGSLLSSLVTARNISVRDYGDGRIPRYREEILNCARAETWGEGASRLVRNTVKIPRSIQERTRVFNFETFAFSCSLSSSPSDHIYPFGESRRATCVNISLLVTVVSRALLVIARPFAARSTNGEGDAYPRNYRDGNGRPMIKRDRVPHFL